MLEKKTRNTNVDIIRGIAMLLVVLGHTITGCTSNSEESFLFNVIWSLQIPLFMIISGYVTRYSRVVKDSSSLKSYLKRKTLAYLLPWLIWTFIVRGLVFGQTYFFDIKYLFWHMDIGYWFLFTIWIISIIFGLSELTASKYANNAMGLKYILIIGAVYVTGMIILMGSGVIWGLSFLGIKLTLYYMPFYFVGFLYGKLQDKIDTSDKGCILTQIVIAVSLAIWLAIILRINLYTISDSGIDILLRAFTSLVGCIAVCGLCKDFFGQSTVTERIGRGLQWAGSHSIEIYMLHIVYLTIIKLETNPDFMEARGLLLAFGNYFLTVVLTCGTAALLNKNRILRIMLFGKSK